jgi:signal transduction histidine kinase
MNSVTPISSLSETILMILGSEKEYENWEHLDGNNFLDVVSSVRTIQNRSEGLFNFVTEYRKLTKIPSPKKEDVLLSELLGNVEQLWRPEIEKTQIKFSIQLQEDDLMISVDPTLIEQVLINLVKNSIQALENKSKPELQICAFKTADGINILVKDNGHGIAPAIAKDIFVPFYTTKEKGSGIGLSLSRQIMRMHNGSISVQSIRSKETIFSLKF